MDIDLIMRLIDTNDHNSMIGNDLSPVLPVQGFDGNDYRQPLFDSTRKERRIAIPACLDNQAQSCQSFYS